ncbi:hypothetical protein A2382_04620 [Candidatus Woesebacteria bacterium RIFOXYB1_FULL_38_16]|uniref:N-acetyltransferase domain-containing protein n=1 Tax=Candidatus Woesebacteria bacterium RIFOXYB1_FULL_38_16 TaxID=1802538 RepID=A0A1F8CUD4_9BACT|nr:MAG: hypothetical protein A2382_04620 [Candidatus Woesebacteria bacterium RIFOXYB1_FULL_38_16]
MRMMILERDRIGVLAVSNPLFVKGAFEGEKLIGVIEVATDGHVNYMVHPDYRGLKIATNLLNQAIDDARDGGVNKLVASVIAGSASETILQKAGFADEGMLSSGATKSRNKLYTRNLD